MQKNCRQCSREFEITDEDLKFYDKVSPVFNGKKYLIPPPTHCPDCRQRRRLVFNNELKLYPSKCDLSQKDIISNYHPLSPYKVYNQKDWFSESKWNPLDFGRAFNFSQPFFEQLQKLLQDVPHPALLTDYTINQNSEFTNYTSSLKNCFLIFHADFDEDCLYGYGIKKCKNCSDCLRILECSLCYECIDCSRCYNLKFSQNCENSHDSWFLNDCIGCRNCFQCTGLRNKNFYIKNKPYSKKKYEEYLAQFGIFTFPMIQKLISEYKKISQTTTKKKFTFGKLRKLFWRLSYRL